MPSTYLITADPVPTFDGAPLEGVHLPDRTVFSVAERDFPRLPDLRRWLASQQAAIRSESGSAAMATTTHDADLYLITAPVSVSARVTGITLEQTPCPHCGLPTETLRSGPTATIHPTLQPAPLALVMGVSWIMSAPLLTALDDHDLTACLHRTPMGNDRQTWAVWPDRLVAGVGYPLGPEPCPACGRASRTTDGRREFAPPRFGLGITVPRPQGEPGWWWHAVYGQGAPIVSGAVARALRAHVPDAGAIRLPDVGATDAFLREEYR
jgi:hypothetical protein